MRTIVIVEDQPVLASAYRNKFRGEGFNVEVALDGEEGLDLIIRIRPDLVLLDLQLPKLSGLEVLKRVRSNPALQALPIVVLSSLAKPGSVEEAWQAGATLVLSKFNTSPKRVLESVQATLTATPAPFLQDSTVVNAESRAHLTAQTTGSESAKVGVLLVEDHSDLSTLLAYLLRRAGHQVTCVKNNAEARRHVNEFSFDLFLLGQSDDSGSLCKQLNLSRPHTPIIIYSTAALFSEQQAGLRAGASAFLVKPEDLFNIGQIASEILIHHEQAVRPKPQAA